MLINQAKGTALVRKIEWYAQTRIFDPEWLHDIEESERQFSESPPTEHDLMTRDDLQAMIDRLYDDNPGISRRYPLPAHWHWMGEPRNDPVSPWACAAPTFRTDRRPDLD